jgi:uncharacterized protein (DUF362 family)
MSSRVSLVQGTERRENIVAALDAVAGDIESRLDVDEILVKPNLVTADNPLAVTHPDAVRGVLDWLRRRTDTPIVVGEATAFTSTQAAFAVYGYLPLEQEYRAVRLADLNSDDPVELWAYDWRLCPRRLQASRLAVHNRLRISVAPPKTHDTVLVTLGLKNMVMGGLISALALRDAHAGKQRRSLAGRMIHAGEAFYVALPRPIRNSYPIATAKELAFGNLAPSHKASMHQGFSAMHLNLFAMAPHLHPELTVIDGFEAMEGNGPCDGEAVDWHIALAGTDWLAVDVATARLMGFALEEVGYLWYCARAGYGAHAPEDIEWVANVAPESVARRFRRHALGSVQDMWRSPRVERQIARALA